MKRSTITAILLGGSMLLASVSASVLTPTHYLSEHRPPMVLDKIVPTAFGDWREEVNTQAVVVNPEMAATLRRIYSQTLSRTYINRDGERVMLSIAYGGDQSDAMQVHYPEVCYPAQGFQLMSNRNDLLDSTYGPIPVRRLETNLAQQRYEPVTYWTTVGDHAVRGGISKKLAEIQYGLHGQIPDGLLFRVSSIDRDVDKAFRLQNNFVQELARHLAPEARQRLMGLPL
jgi:EpsI family protein